MDRLSYVLSKSITPRLIVFTFKIKGKMLVSNEEIEKVRKIVSGFIAISAIKSDSFFSWFSKKSNPNILDSVAVAVNMQKIKAVNERELQEKINLLASTLVRSFKWAGVGVEYIQAYQSDKSLEEFAKEEQ